MSSAELRQPPGLAGTFGRNSHSEPKGVLVESYAHLADDTFVNLNLNTEIPLAASRETVLAFFERVQKSYPTMRNFYTRENGDFVLEEDKEQPSYRWVALEARRICSGMVNPPNVEAALEQHRLILQLIPFMLTVSPLDCEAMDLLMGFDYVYRGNHHELVANTLGASPLAVALTDAAGERILSCEPSITIALDEQCRRQSRLLVESRTTAYQVRRNEFGEEPISVYFTVRQYGSLPPGATYEQTLAELRQTSESLLDAFVVPQVLRPLAQAIAAR